MSSAHGESAKESPILTLAISSRALFDLEESNRVYEEEGLAAYRNYQTAHEDDTLSPGEAFEFVRKILSLNDLLGRAGVEVILLSRNTADTGLRVFNSIEAHGLGITRAAFCGGEPPWRYIAAFGCDLFLSTEAVDVAHALDQGIAAASLLRSQAESGGDDVLRIAFDGDNVLFTDEAEKIYLSEGREAFEISEAKHADTLLPGGPFQPVLRALHKLQLEFEEGDCPIRTALVTARSVPAHKRVIRTLREWGIRLDECLFLGGQDKGAFLKAFGADVFFDDRRGNCESVAQLGLAGHVPSPDERTRIVAASESTKASGNFAKMDT